MAELKYGSHAFRPLSATEWVDWVAELILRREDEAEAMERARAEQG